MELISKLVEAYADEMTSNPNSQLQQINEATIAHHPKHHMISGKLQGQFLRFLSNMIRPKFVLEIGTFTGYSALCLAEGMVNDGQLHTIELRAADAAIAQANFNVCKWHNQIHLHLGNAKDIIPTLSYNWDLVFIDADKTAYIDYYELVLEKLNDSGIIIVDNVMFHGQVLEMPLKGKNALAIDAFNRYVANDNRVEQLMLTIRDGLLLIKKKQDEKISGNTF